MKLLKNCLILSNNETLEAKYKDHALKGNYICFRECHIKPDLLLVYRKIDDILELYLANLGNHNNIFQSSSIENYISSLNIAKI